MKIHHALFALIMVCFCSASAQAKALTVMISGGFKTAWETLGPVSYTHLTLPTICSV